MIFSKACEYGIRAIIYIADQSLHGKTTSLKDISVAINSPLAFTAKILQILVKHKALSSTKGPNGGFHISPADMDNIYLNTIVTAIDGKEIFYGCGLGLPECNENQPCPVHDAFKCIREDLKRMTETTSVRQLASGLKEGLTFLKR